MPQVAFSDSYATIWRGKDCLSFLDGLSSNQVIGLSPNRVIQSAILDKNAKIIDLVIILNLGDFLAVIGYRPNYDAMLEFITPKILDSDVSISDISELNDIAISYDEITNIEIGSCETISDITIARLCENMEIHIAAKIVELDCEKMTQKFHEWRIEHQIPWYGYEIKRGSIPYNSGINELVHESKGCYTGQEILTRMRTRNRGIKILRTLDNSEVNPQKVSTKGTYKSLVIVNQ